MENDRRSRCASRELRVGLIRQGWGLPGLVQYVACTECGTVETRLANREAFETVKPEWLPLAGDGDPRGEPS